MKISYNWLKQFIKLDWDAKKAGELLTDLGLEVEGIDPFSSVLGGLEGIVVGHVVECEPHPNADRLKLTKVDVGEIAVAVEAELEAYYQANPLVKRPVVAVMGCMVNGPGEAKEADIALAGGTGKFGVYVAGKHVRSVAQADAVAAVLEEVVSFDSDKPAEQLAEGRNIPE